MEKENLIGYSELPLKLPMRHILANEVYENVRELLMDRYIEPGSRINIDFLSRKLQISQTPIREALARLESEGLVTKEPLRGYFSAPLLDSSSFNQLYEMRLVIEPAIAKKAAEKISIHDLLILEEKVLEMQKAKVGQTYKEYQRFFTMDAAFHDFIAQVTGNVFLYKALERLHAHLHLYRLYFSTGIAPETILEHQEILNALQQHNAEAAALAMTQHLSQAQSRLGRSVFFDEKRHITADKEEYERG